LTKYTVRSIVIVEIKQEVKGMKQTLTKEQRNVAFAASTDEARGILCTVLIGDGKIVATDGFILAEAEIEHDPKDNGKTLLISATDILKSKDNKLTGGVILSANGDNNVTLMGTDTLVTTPWDGSFPNYKQLYNGLDNEVLKIGMGSNVLQKLLKVCGKDAHITFTFFGSERPIKYSSGEVSGIFMPATIQR